MFFASHLSSPGLQEKWNEYYITQRKDAPLNNLANQIASNNSLYDDPELLSFMIHYTDLLRGGIIRKITLNCEPEDHILKTHLDSLSFNLHEARGNKELIPAKDLPEAHRKILRVIEKETAQTSFDPFSAIGRSAKSMAGHMWDEVQENKIPVALSGLLTLAAIKFMNTNFDNGGGAVNIDPMLIGITPDNIGEDGSYAGILTEQEIAELTPICHSHIQQLLFDNAAAADFALSIPGVESIFGPHCAKFENYQDYMWQGYNAYNGRLEEGIGNPLQALGSMVAPGTQFAETYEEMSQKHFDWMVAANTFENSVLHFALLGIGIFQMAKKIYKGKKPDMGEAGEEAGKIKNFFNRTIKKTPLNYLGTTTGIAIAMSQGPLWSATEGLNPVAVYLALAGMFAGQSAHKIYNYLNSQDKTRNIIGKDADKLKEISTENTGKATVAPQKKTLLKHLKAPLLGAAFGAVAIKTDFELTGGIASAHFAAATGIWGAWLGFNPIEDSSFHVGFYGVGAAVGASFAAATKFGIWKPLCFATRPVKKFVQKHLKPETSRA